MLCVFNFSDKLHHNPLFNQTPQTPTKLFLPFKNFNPFVCFVSLGSKIKNHWFVACPSRRKNKSKTLSNQCCYKKTQRQAKTKCAVLTKSRANVRSAPFSSHKSKLNPKSREIDPSVLVVYFCFASWFVIQLWQNLFFISLPIKHRETRVGR